MNPISIKNYQTLKAIFSKRRRGRAEKGLLVSIVRRYKTYDQAAPDFTDISPSRCTRILVKNKILLYNLYESTTPEAIDIKTSVLALAILRCPYCGKPGKPDTLDHILPRSLYPEYSLHTKNLIPCCHACNHAKGTKFYSTKNQRLFLNPYHDSYLSEKFVIIDIQPDPETHSFESPLFEIRFDSTQLNEHQIQTAKHHFSELDVSSALRNYCASQLRVLRRHFQSEIRNNTLSQQSLLDHINRCADSNAIEHGPNCWEHLFYQALLTNSPLIDYICNTPITHSPPIL